MDNVGNYPLAPLLDALRTVTGRVVLVVAAVVIGAALGGISATHHLGGAWVGIFTFFAWAASSFFFGVGIIAFPAAFIFALLFIRSEWPLWTIGVVALLISWNSHKTLHYLLNESAGAKLHKQMTEDIAKGLREQQKSR